MSRIFSFVLAGVCALHASAAAAATYAGTALFSESAPVDFTLKSGQHYLLTYELLDELPTTVSFNPIGKPNQWFNSEYRWESDGKLYAFLGAESIVVDSFRHVIRFANRTSWSVEMFWVNEFNNCGLSPINVGQICGRSFEAWWNAGWYPITTDDPDQWGSSYRVQYTISEIPEPGVWSSMMTGFLILGTAIRGRYRQTAPA